MIRQHHRITSAIALALALTATAAPCASADAPALAKAGAAIAAAASQHSSPQITSMSLLVNSQLPGQRTSPSPCSEVCSGGGYSYRSPNAVATKARPAVSGRGYDWVPIALPIAAIALIGLSITGARTVTIRRRHTARV